ncbi:SigE family RNA polymerase sigma factor [Glycomyces terrestris]|uniref:SigE family RNA polymerase sigma factor n=1 Tax=Glycomyces terrestris TaxID=2493553 RepID=A0A426V1C2_9ACTN|nr:SigE family RNA polymerase sigma factor [Glycomyces terrestris]RRS00662.1 SigE family RNA polymerase sigma factor [Glycomyces terrestris]
MSGPTAPPGAPQTRQGEFEDFVRARSGALCASAFLLTGDRGLAEDLVQDALARTWRSWKRLHQTANAEAYTRRTMYHLHVSRWRRRKVAEIAVDAVPERAGREPDTALRLAVHAALLSLPPTQRAAIVLRYFEDRTEAAAAAILDCPITTLRARVQRGLRRLRVRFPELVLGDPDAQLAQWEREFNAEKGERRA